MKRKIIMSLVGGFVGLSLALLQTSHWNKVEVDTYSTDVVIAESFEQTELPTVQPTLEPKQVNICTYSFVEPSTESPEMISMGTFKITAYCSCRKCCGKWADNRRDGIVRGASGQQLIPDYSIAIDPSIIPYGNEVYINGRKYVAHDCGVKGNSIDLYMDNHQKALEWGVQYIEVFRMIDK